MWHGAKAPDFQNWLNQWIVYTILIINTVLGIVTADIGIKGSQIHHNGKADSPGTMNEVR